MQLEKLIEEKREILNEAVLKQIPYSEAYKLSLEMDELIALYYRRINEENV